MIINYPIVIDISFIFVDHETQFKKKKVFLKVTLLWILMVCFIFQYGLYTAFMGCFMYTIFGSCKNLTVGPTAIMSIMTAEHAAAGGVTYVILITFLSGCIQLLMGLLNLGNVNTF